MLIFLIADLMRDPTLQKRFSDDPHKVMAQYNLRDSARLAMGTMTVDEVLPMIRQELLVARSAGPGIRYGNPKAKGPIIDTFQPEQFTTGGSFEITIRGAKFDRTPGSMLFRIGNRQTWQEVWVRNVQISGSLENSKLTADVTLVDATNHDVNVEPGLYTIYLENTATGFFGTVEGFRVV